MGKILLVGATGLIGAEVFQKLSGENEVVCLGRRPESDLKGDLSKPESLADLDLKGFEAVVHCAGVTDEDLKHRPAEAFVQSTQGMNALIQRAIAGSVKRFVYVSTSHVYGPQQGVIDENTPANPLSDYAIAHYAAEQTLKRNAAKFENSFVLRPNAVFGVPVFIDKFDRWSLIPYSFPLEAVYSQKIVLLSTGEQNRNFVGTKDIANCISELLSFSNDEVFTIVNPLGKETMSVYDFALKCAEVSEKVTGTKSRVERPEPEGKFAEAMFQYRSQLDLKSSQVDLTDSLTHLFSKIFEEFKNGKKY